MKKPLLDQIDRFIMRKSPDTYYSARMQLYLAVKKLNREIGSKLEPIFKWLFRPEG